MAPKESVFIRQVRQDELDAVNDIIESCVMSWDLPERVKRLSLSSYRYRPYDLKHFEMMVAEATWGEIIGVAVWEPASTADLPENKAGLLLHGLYVAPQHQDQGVGGQLINSALEAVCTQRMDGLLVKAQSDAIGYFRSRGFTNLPIENPTKDYPHRWWRAISEDEN